MNPNEDQYLAAAAHARRIVDDVHRAKPDLVALHPDTEPVPRAVLQWIKAHAEEMDARTLRFCGHGPGLSQPLFVLGNEPNVARCATCQDVRAAELAKASAGQLLDCHLCGLPETVDRLSVCVFNAAAIVVRAFACDNCLTAPNPFVKSA